MNSNPTHASIFGTTTNPCPSWCTLEPGHGYDSYDKAGEYRGHEHEIGILSEDVPGTPTHVFVFVAVEAMEILSTTSDGMHTELSPVHITIDTNSGDMNGPQAREVARMLVEAAELWDQVTGS